MNSYNMCFNLHLPHYKGNECLCTLMTPTFGSNWVDCKSPSCHHAPCGGEFPSQLSHQMIQPAVAEEKRKKISWEDSWSSLNQLLPVCVLYRRIVCNTRNHRRYLQGRNLLCVLQQLFYASLHLASHSD